MAAPGVTAGTPVLPELWPGDQVRACVILAAGEGSRLRAKGNLKPLLTVGGLSLIERAVVTANRAGLTQFYIVTGHDAPRLEAFLAGLAGRRRISITAVRSSDWQAGNGASLVAAEKYVREPFLLLMGDHIFEESSIRSLARTPVGSASVLLASDSSLSANPFIEPDEATKVRVDAGRVVAIGKDLEEFDAYDTGMFLCTPEVFEAARAARIAGDASLSGAIRLLASRGRALVHPLGDRRWIDVDTPHDKELAEELLRQGLTKPHDGWVSRRLNRPVSTRLITPLLMRAVPSITPNQVSVLGLLVGLSAGCSFLLGSAPAGGLLIHLASVLDGSDGEVARLKKTESGFGGFFDAVVDRYSDSFVLFAMAYFGWVAAPEVGWWGDVWRLAVLTGGFLAISGNLMVSYTSSKAELDLGLRYSGRWIAAGRGRDLRLLILAVAGVLSVVHPVSAVAGILVVAVIANLIVLRRVALAGSVGRSSMVGSRRPVRAAVFDFDGTLANTMPFLTELAVSLMIREFGVSPEAARRRYRETSGKTFSDQIRELFPGHRSNERVTGEFEAIKSNALLEQPLFPETLPTLRALGERGIGRFVVSSTSAESILEYAREHGLDAELDGIAGFTPSMPKVQQLASILEEHGFEAGETVFVGDSAYDHDLARELGMRFVGVGDAFASLGVSGSRFMRAAALDGVVPLIAPFRVAV